MQLNLDAEWSSLVAVIAQHTPRKPTVRFYRENDYSFCTIEVWREHPEVDGLFIGEGCSEHGFTFAWSKAVEALQHSMENLILVGGRGQYKRSEIKSSTVKLSLDDLLGG